MLARTPRPAGRSGTATVEAAVVLSLLVVPLLIGVWEMGRLVHAQQVVSNACREGARLAAQARMLKDDGTTALITWTTSSPNVADTVYMAVVTGGLHGLAKTDVNVDCSFRNADGSVNTTWANPYQAPKGQRFRVEVSVPFDKVRWVNIGLINPSTVRYSVDWFMLVDDPFTVNVTMPAW